jgi:hypothetical protein
MPSQPVIDTGGIGLQGIYDDGIPATIMLLQRNHTTEKINPHQRRFTSLSGKGVGWLGCGHKTFYQLFQHLIRHSMAN